MKYIFIIICLFSISVNLLFSSTQDSTRNELLRLSEEYNGYVVKGDFVNAEKTVESFFKYSLTPYLEGNAYSRYASIYVSLGRFEEALNYLRKIEKLDLTETEKEYLYPYAYILKTVIFDKKHSYYQAMEYTEKSIRIYKTALPGNELYFSESLATAYHNLGGYYNTLGQYQKALSYFTISLNIRDSHHFPDKGLTFSSMAKSYVGLGQMEKAEAYFRRSIETTLNEYGQDYYRLPEFYFNYGEFLQNSGRMAEASGLFRLGLNKCLSVYGEKNIQTSRANSYLAKNYLLSGNIDSSLCYYQKSLISIVDGFNDPDIAKNPRIGSSILDTRLMENLKGKSLAFEMLAEQQEGEKRLKTLGSSLETIILALDLIDVIRNNYPSDEIKMFSTANEKETYMSALRVAEKISAQSGDKSFMQTMYGIALRAKAAVLRDQIAGNSLLYSSSLPVSFRDEHHRLSSNIAGYNKLILDESEKKNPDTAKINMWKDELFEMNNSRERLTDSISKYFPQYAELMRKTVPISPSQVQAKLEKDELIIDYFISREFSEGKRTMYMFLVSRDDISVLETEVDSAFNKYEELIRKNADPYSRKGDNSGYISALHYFYEQLIKPAEKFITRKRLIIIPDEEINRLPFEAFLRDLPEAGKNDFDGLHFLLNDYVISHAYSASLLPDKKGVHGKKRIYSFSPSYGIGSGLDSLGGAVREILNVNSMMGGKMFTLEQASKANFLNALDDPVLFHLAMHSISDTANSLYSYLLFQGNGKNDENAKLYNYEVSLSKISSPLIVLSSCNSGSGNLYSGEGQLSLARSFLLAGASAVVKTSWDVNDDSGSGIITRFYYYLSKGESKDKALQLAKLEFINNSTPAFRDPYYWAAYEILGDNGPVTKNNRIVTFVTILIIICSGLFFYFRRRRTFSAASR